MGVSYRHLFHFNLPLVSSNHGTSIELDDIKEIRRLLKVIRSPHVLSEELRGCKGSLASFPPLLFEL
jgi:hypothetical protein